MNKVRVILLVSEDEKTLYQKICDTFTQVGFIKIVRILLIEDKNSTMNIAGFSTLDEYICHKKGTTL